MKIIGIAHINGKEELLLKGDSALLVNRKPFFTPEYVGCLSGHPCVVARICRLGKDINRKFAARYYDALALGINFVDEKGIAEAKTNQSAWTTAITFDNSLAVGEFVTLDEGDCTFSLTQERMAKSEDAPQVVRSLCMDMGAMKDKIECAICEASKYITIRQGDMLFVDNDETPLQLQLEDCIIGKHNEKEALYCKIK